jgi:hypothetical protein
LEGEWEAEEAAMRWRDSGGAMDLGEVHLPQRLKGLEGRTEQGWLFVQSGR